MAVSQAAAPSDSSGGVAGGGWADLLINGKYRLLRKIGSGSFGEIYLGIHITSKEVCACHGGAPLIPRQRLHADYIVDIAYTPPYI